MMDFLGGLEASGVGTWMRESPSLWAFPTVLAFHTLGLALIAGTNVAVNLRILGVAPRIPLQPLVKLFHAEPATKTRWWYYRYPTTCRKFFFLTETSALY